MKRLALLAVVGVFTFAACVAPTPPPILSIACNTTPGYTGPERCVWYRTADGLDVHGPFYSYLPLDGDRLIPPPPGVQP